MLASKAAPGLPGAPPKQVVMLTWGESPRELGMLKRMLMQVRPGRLTTIISSCLLRAPSAARSHLSLSRLVLGEWACMHWPRPPTPGPVGVRG